MTEIDVESRKDDAPWVQSVIEKVMDSSDPRQAAIEEVREIQEEFEKGNNFMENRLDTASDREVIFVTERFLVNLDRLAMINKMFDIPAEGREDVVEGATEQEIEEMERLTEGEITDRDVERMKEIWREG